MTKLKELKEAGFGDLKSANQVLLDNLQALTDNAPAQEVGKAAKALRDFLVAEGASLKVDKEQDKHLLKMAGWFDLLRNVSHALGMLLVADHQRANGRVIQVLHKIDALIQACYQPIVEALGAGAAERLLIRPEHILAIRFQDQYLARPAGPAPYIIVPNFLPANRRDGLIGVAHEVGHHVYRQVKGLQDEIEIAVIDALRASDAKFDERQQRLWSFYTEESFADIFGILTMGAAFLKAQQPILLYAGVRRRFRRHQRNGEPGEDFYLQGLLVGRDRTHPMALLRGLMGLYAYSHLVGSAPNSHLPGLRRFIEIRDTLAGNASAELELTVSQEPEPFGFAITERAMEIVVETILDKSLWTLNCKALRDLVPDFAADENMRDRVAAASRENRQPPQGVTERHLVAGETLSQTTGNSAQGR